MTIREIGGRAVGAAPPWQRLALWAVRGYRGRQDYDDIAQEALVGALLGVRKQQHGALGRCTELQAAVQGARWAANEYARLACGGARCREIPALSLETLMENEGGPWEPSAPDFAPSLIEREALLARLTELTEEQAEVLRRKAAGEAVADIAAAMGKTVKRIAYVTTRARQALKETQ